MIRWFGALLLALGLLAAGPARAEWMRAESPNFIVFSEGSESRLRERVIRLEQFDRLLRELSRGEEPPAENKLHVYVTSGPQDLRIVRSVPQNVSGFYSVSADGIAAFIDASVEGQGDHVLFHEYVHHFMWQYAPNAYPAWYIEGFAEYLMTTRFQGRRVDIGDYAPGRIHALSQGQWLPPERLLFSNKSGLNPTQVGMFYAQSWAAAHWFHSTPQRHAALLRYLASAHSSDPAAAFTAATGLTPIAWAEEVRRYTRSGSVRFRRIEREAREQPAAMTITRLPRAANDLLLLDATVRVGVREDLRPDYLRRIRAAAALHRDDPWARRVLATAEALIGEPAAADALLDPMLAAAPGDAELMYWKGMRHLRAVRAAEAGRGTPPAAESRSARDWLARAHQADPNHFQTLYRYSEALRGDRRFASENTRNIMLLAHQLAPQVPEIRMNAAMHLIGRGETAEAVALLVPLANDPHDSGLAASARQLIERARNSRPATRSN